jgi:hypothetical protein
MKTLSRLALGFALAAGLVPLLAGSASGHSLSGATITCDAVTGTFHDFTAGDHPIVWHVKVADGSFTDVSTVESPPAFVGSGTATADISALTSTLQGTSATVQAFATWSTGQSATTSADLTCGTPEVSPATTPTTPTTLAPQVSAGEATAPAAVRVTPLVSPATAVVGAPRFTG